MAGSISVILLSCAVSLGQSLARDPDQYFRDTVRPILAKQCWECHGAEVQESGLRLDSLAGLQAGGQNGKTLAVAGKPDESYLIEVLRHDGDVAMPPDNKLPDDEIQAIAEWIRMGLPWPGTNSPLSPAPLTKEETRAQQLKAHWAFQPIVPPAPPAVSREEWIAQPLDRFILAHLDSKALTPSPEADRYTLIRRLKFDLLGLPPTHGRGPGVSPMTRRQVLTSSWSIAISVLRITANAGDDTGSMSRAMRTRVVTLLRASAGIRMRTRIGTMSFAR